MLHAERGGATIAMIVTMVLIIGILGNGLLGAGMRAVQEREKNILRRFKVTPISPLPILSRRWSPAGCSSPGDPAQVGLAHFLYGMPMPDDWFSLFMVLALGAVRLPRHRPDPGRGRRTRWPRATCWSRCSTCRCCS